MNHWKIVKSIWQKVEAKNPVGKIRGMFSKTPSGFSLRCLPEANVSSSGGHDKNATNRGLVSYNYETVKSTAHATNVRYLNFNTEQERYNAWQSYLTKFARFCICMDESTKLAPYMGNYTQPWDDQRFYEYFGLNKIEIQLIETVIK
jgi:hypothetical protein